MFFFNCVQIADNDNASTEEEKQIMLDLNHSSPYSRNGKLRHTAKHLSSFAKSSKLGVNPLHKTADH